MGWVINYGQMGQVNDSKLIDSTQEQIFLEADLRHTFASLLLSSNVPLLYVSHQLGARQADDDVKILCAVDSERAGSSS